MRPIHSALLAAGVLVTAGCSDGPTDPTTLQTNSVAAFIPNHAAVRARLRQILEQQNGGLGFEMWATRKSVV